MSNYPREPRTSRGESTEHRTQTPRFEYRKGGNGGSGRRPPYKGAWLVSLRRFLRTVGDFFVRLWWSITDFCKRLPALFARLSTRGKAVVGGGLLVLVAIPIVIVAVTAGSGGAKPASGSGVQETPAVKGVVELVATPTPTITPVPTPTLVPTPSPTPVPHPSNTIIKYGMTAPCVAEIQERLMDLDYMEADEPTEYFGSITQSAIKLFQRQHELAQDGKVGMETFTLLMGDQATKYTVTIGADGTDVEELQDRLRELGYMDDVTGHFGEATEAAVKKFQGLNDLTQDGKVGTRTREALYSADAKANFMKYGEKSDDVKEYQTRLKKLGYLTTTPDGTYGKDTVAAVKRFQEINGLIADGFLGYKTTKLLKSSSAAANALKLGMEGDDVLNVQKRLKTLGYMSATTGYFGSATDSAVRAFQKRNSLSVDGTVGKSTMTKLTSSSAKKASSGSSSSSGGSSSSATNTTGVEKMISVAKSKLGCTYVFSAKGPNTFDCSGFVYYCLNQAGISQGYMTSASWKNSTKYPKITSMSKMERGDIICFNGHVAIYLGDGQMIDASSGQGKVRIASGIKSSSYWTRNFICAFRVFG